MQRGVRRLPKRYVLPQLEALTELDLIHLLIGLGAPTQGQQTKQELIQRYYEAYDAARQAHLDRLRTVNFTEAELQGMTVDDLGDILDQRWHVNGRTLKKADMIQRILQEQRIIIPQPQQQFQPPPQQQFQPPPQQQFQPPQFQPQRLPQFQLPEPLPLPLPRPHVYTEGQLRGLTIPRLREINIGLGGGTGKLRLKQHYIEAILQRQGGVILFGLPRQPISPRQPTTTPLTTAATRADVATVQSLLLNKADLSSDDINRAWIAAAHLDDGTIARLIYDAGVPNLAYQDNEAFRWIAYKGHVDLVRRLLQEPTVDPTANRNEAWKDVTTPNGLQQRLAGAYAQIKTLLAADPRVQQSLGLEPTYTTLVDLQNRLLRPFTEPPRAHLVQGGTGEDFFFEPEKFAQYIRGHIIPNPGGQTIILPDWFLTSEDMTTFQQVMQALGYGGVQGSFEELFQLLLWTYHFDAPFKVTPELAQQIAALTPEEQLALLTPSYTGPTDTAGRIFSLYTLRRPPAYDWFKPDLVDRYATISQYSPLTVYRLAKYLYGYDGGNASPLSPYRLIATKPASPLDMYIIQYNNRPEAMAQYVGMLFPPGEKDKEAYFFTNLRFYTDVVTSPLRQQGLLQPPPLLKNMAPAMIHTVLAPYTDIELMEAYEVFPLPGMTRPTLIQRIVDEAAETGSRWHFRKRSCANDTVELRNINIVTGEPRLKNDPTDPILSFGTLYDYHCYNLSELMGSFDFDNPELKDTFRFKPPDYVKGDLMSEFPDASIRQLQTLLQETLNPIWQPLLDKIRLGFEYKAEMGRMLTQRGREFNAMPDADKQLVRLYLSWLFTLGMTMRFWKGPGFPYPHIWVEGGGGVERCETATRDANVVKKFAERTGILSKMSRPLEEWVLSLPRVKYNFQTQQTAVGKETIDYVIQEAQRGEFCMADASDRITQTAYFLATRILGLDNTGFNAMLNEYVNPPVPPGAPARPRVNQPPFQPETVGVTGHTDPWHRLEEIPEAQPQRAPTQTNIVRVPTQGVVRTTLPERAPTLPGTTAGLVAADILQRAPNQGADRTILLERAPTLTRPTAGLNAVADILQTLTAPPVGIVTANIPTLPRARTRRTQLTRAPVGGRREAGALRLGELEAAFQQVQGARRNLNPQFDEVD
jgi:hypothetical protein